MDSPFRVAGGRPPRGAGAIGKVFGPRAERRFLRALDLGSAGLLWVGVAAIAAVIVIAVITSFL